LGDRTERRRKAESIAETVEQQQSYIEDDEAEIQRMRRLDELQRFTAKRPTSRLVDLVVNIFENSPEVVPDVQSRTDIGAASRAQVGSAREELVKSRLAIEKAKTRINKLRQTFLQSPRSHPTDTRAPRPPDANTNHIPPHLGTTVNPRLLSTMNPGIETDRRRSTLNSSLIVYK
jgi:hypothetical protein